MRLAAVAATLLAPAAIGAAASQAPPIDLAPLVCLSSQETRQLFAADKLVPPFRVMREAAFATQAEPIDIELCRIRGALVYDVTLLKREGHVVHKLVSATSGEALGERDGRPLPPEPNGGPGPHPPE